MKTTASLREAWCNGKARMRIGNIETPPIGDAAAILSDLDEALTERNSLRAEVGRLLRERDILMPQRSPLVSDNLSEFPGIPVVKLFREQLAKFRFDFSTAIIERDAALARVAELEESLRVRTIERDHAMGGIVGDNDRLARLTDRVRELEKAIGEHRRSIQDGYDCDPAPVEDRYLWRVLDEEGKK